MAAEAIGLGASVVSFVGLAGQILEGCLFIRGFLDDLEDAPADIQTLRLELSNFQSSVRAFQSLLEDEQAFGDDVHQALDFSYKCITELQKVLAKLGKKGEGFISNFFSVARKGRILKHAENLKSARIQLLSAQSNLIIFKEQGLRLLFLTFAEDVDTRSCSLARLFARPFRCMSDQAYSNCKSFRIYPLSRINQPEITGTSESSGSKLLDDTSTTCSPKYGECTDLPPETINMIKDAIRGLLVEYYTQEFPSKDRKDVGISQSPVAGGDLSTGYDNWQIPRYRTVLQQSLRRESFQRNLGLFTITIIRTQWRLGKAQGGGGFWAYAETKMVIALDPDLTRIPYRLFTTLTSRSELHYQSNFDPVLRVCHSVKYNSKIVEACRSGDLVAVRNLFASGFASPFDQSDNILFSKNYSLLDIVFTEIRLHLNQPVSVMDKMVKLGQLFKYLVDQGLDPGELSEHFIPRKPLKRTPIVPFNLPCSFCWSTLPGSRYECEYCQTGYALCKSCLATGRCCAKPQHNNLQPRLQTQGVIYYRHSALEILATLDYTKEFGPLLLEIGRTILRGSAQDPFQNSKMHELLWCKEAVGIQSPVFELILNQDMWQFEVYKDGPSTPPNYIPKLSAQNWLHRDPLNSIIRILLRSTKFNSVDLTAWLGKEDGRQRCSFIDSN